MPPIAIKHRWTGATLFECEAADIKKAVKKAVADGADLTGADLTGADLTGANLTGADLTGADLTGADLTGADLTGADLTGANLAGADLTGANLAGADLEPIKADFYAVLLTVPGEVPGLLTALREGRIDGSTYHGECACLVGTIANERHCHFRKIPGLFPDSTRPAERFFLAILRGDTPTTNPVAAIVEGWITEWIATNPSQQTPEPITIYERSDS